MYNSFDEAFAALLDDPSLDEARGGQVLRTEQEFDYWLYGQPEKDGDVFLEMNPSSTPTVKWRPLFVAGQEAEQAYRAFITNPQYGHLFIE